MDMQFTIRSREDQASLELRPLDRDFFVAEVHGRGLSATARVSSYLSDGLADFFGELARDWRGWSGGREWGSLEGELSLRAESDRTGHVTLSVHLQDGSPARWRTMVNLVVEAGQLDRIAVEARQFEALVLREQAG